MNIDKLVKDVIPPIDYQHRNGFNNFPIIDELTENEKKSLEIALIQKLESETGNEIDTLIVETLAHLNSKQSLPILYNLLKKSNIDISKLEIAASIFEINQDAEMIDIAISHFKKIDGNKDAYRVYAVSGAFYYLAKFNDEKTKKLIKEYISDSEYLISYNAKKTLEI